MHKCKIKICKDSFLKVPSKEDIILLDINQKYVGSVKVFHSLKLFYNLNQFKLISV